MKWIIIILLLSIAGCSTAEAPMTAPEPVSVSVVNHDTPEECLAKTVWGEARGCNLTEQAAVVWCILNRVDSDLAYMPDDIISVVTQPGQFSGYREDNPVTDDIYALVVDVLCRWEMEQTCIGSVGRVLPQEYMWFSGDGQHNHYRTAYRGGEVWDWSLTSPYED